MTALKARTVAPFDAEVVTRIVVNSASENDGFAAAGSSGVVGITIIVGVVVAIVGVGIVIIVGNVVVGMVDEPAGDGDDDCNTDVDDDVKEDAVMGDGTTEDDISTAEVPAAVAVVTMVAAAVVSEDEE